MGILAGVVRTSLKTAATVAKTTVDDEAKVASGSGTMTAARLLNRLKLWGGTFAGSTIAFTVGSGPVVDSAAGAAALAVAGSIPLGAVGLARGKGSVSARIEPAVRVLCVATPFAGAAWVATNVKSASKDK